MVRSGVPIKKISKQRSPTFKSDKKTYKNIYVTGDRIFVSTLKSMINSTISHCPKEILVELSHHLNTIYPKLKDQILNHCAEGYPVKKRELLWENNTGRILDVLHPLAMAINTEQNPLLKVPLEETAKSSDDSMKDVVPTNSHTLNHAIRAYQKKSDSREDLIPLHWPKPLEINFLQIKDADDVATISCKVGDISIPYAMIDSGSDSSIVSENVAKHLGLKIDRKKVHRLNGVASKSQSLGTVNEVPITISNGEDNDTIPDEFSVVPTEYDDNGKELSLFILGTQWQYRAGWEPLVRGNLRQRVMERLSLSPYQSTNPSAMSSLWKRSPKDGFL